MEAPDEQPSHGQKRKREDGEKKKAKRGPRGRHKRQKHSDANGLTSERLNDGLERTVGNNSSKTSGPVHHGQVRNGLLGGKALGGEAAARRKKKRQSRKNTSKVNIEEMEIVPFGTEDNTVVNGAAQSEPRRARKKQPVDRHTTSLTFLRTQEVSSISQSTFDSHWEVSEPCAGRFIDAQPIFSPDEKNVIFATDLAVHIYSTSTSLLVHTLPSRTESSIIAYRLSQKEPERLYLATASGQLSIWNWIDKQRLETWQLNAEINDFSICSSPSEDTIFTVNEIQDQWLISSHRLGSVNENEAESKILFVHEHKICSLKALDTGNVIVAITSKSIIVGKIKTTGQKSLTGLEYSWREFDCTEPIASFDAQYISVDATSSKDSKKKGEFAPNSSQNLDVVIGGAKGCVYVYQDLLTQLRFDKTSKDFAGVTGKLSPRELHWHRQAAEAVSWSRDGNYIISGGHETVLVLWQLDTGMKQFLPHLESPILELVVSPSGSSYAVRLGDNSVMVLSTTELEPKANFPGLQCRGLTSSRSVPRIPTVDATRPSLIGRRIPIAATLNPREPNQLLMAVPASQPFHGTQTILPAPYLQTFDMSRLRHISRQAIARTNATNTNLTPEGATVLEPNVTHIQMSKNGRWLATVDEWAPPLADIEDLAVDEDDNKAAIDARRDISLRFWSWDETRQQWALNSRIMAPHAKSGDQSSARILDLKASPLRTSFATVGEDSCVRIWELRSTSADGALQRGDGAAKDADVDDPKPRKWWVQTNLVSLERNTSTDHLHVPRIDNAMLAFSDDSSVVAAHLGYKNSNTDTGIVHFIDADNATIQESRIGLRRSAGQMHNMEFLGRYLICLGNSGVMIWDVTSFNLVNYIHLHAAPQKHFAPLLAVNVVTNTFAISFPQVKDISSTQDERQLALLTHRHEKRAKKPNDFVGCFQVFSPTSVSPVFETTLPRAAMLLLSTAGTEPNDELEITNVENRGYVYLDCAASLRVIKPRGYLSNGVNADVINGSAHQLELQETDAAEDTEMDHNPEVSDIEVEDSTPTVKGISDLDGLLPPVDKAIVRPEQLAELFDYPSTAMPSMRTMFESVMRLYSGR